MGEVREETIQIGIEWLQTAFRGVTRENAVDRLSEIIKDFDQYRTPVIAVKNELYRIMSKYPGDNPEYYSLYFSDIDKIADDSILHNVELRDIVKPTLLLEDLYKQTKRHVVPDHVGVGRYLVETQGEAGSQVVHPWMRDAAGNNEFLKLVANGVNHLQRGWEQVGEFIYWISAYVEGHEKYGTAIRYIDIYLEPALGNLFAGQESLAGALRAIRDGKI